MRMPCMVPVGYRTPDAIEHLIDLQALCEAAAVQERCEVFPGRCLAENR